MLKNPGADNIYFNAKASVYTADQWYLVMFRAYRDNATYGEVSFRFFVNRNPHSGKLTRSLPSFFSCVTQTAEKKILPNRSLPKDFS